MDPMLSWKSHCFVDEAERPDDCIYEYAGEILNGDTDKTRKPILIGKFRAYYIDVDYAVTMGSSLYDVLDSYAQTFDYYEHIFGENTPFFSDTVHETLDHDILGSNLLILDRIELLPQYRGNNVGLEVLSRMMRRFSPGAGVVAMKPFPLQLENASSSKDDWRQKLKLSDYKDTEEASTQKLVNYYSQLGFLQLPNSCLMVKNTLTL